jgi:hypothetical protein
VAVTFLALVGLCLISFVAGYALACVLDWLGLWDWLGL